MSQEVRQTELKAQTQQLLDGPLKHIKAATLAAALLPLASVAAAPASAQTGCVASSSMVCGLVWDDTNHNGFQDATETGLAGVKVTVYDSSNNPVAELYTNSEGRYFSDQLPSGTYTIVVSVPLKQPSPPDAWDDSFDSDGILDGKGNAFVTLVPSGFPTDFGFFASSAQQPGTGTPGYWKNHPEAWPVQSITVGGVTYTKDQAIWWLGKVGKDKTTTMFSSLVPAMLNVMIHNDDSCVASTIAAANAWMVSYGPVGSNVSASSAAWTIGEPLHMQMDAYNNGLLCAPHRK